MGVIGLGVMGSAIAANLVKMKMLANLGQEYTLAFERVYPEVAAERGVILKDTPTDTTWKIA